jgi:hypothetical protein
VLYFLLLNGCKQNANPVSAGINQKISIIQGQINNWDLGSNNQIRFVIPLNSSPYYYQALDASLISQFGTFALLPPSIPDSLTVTVRNWIPGSSVYISNPDARISNTSTLVVYSPSLNQNIGKVYRTNSKNSGSDNLNSFYSHYIYVTQDVIIKGYDSSSVSAYYMIYYDLNFKKGWNNITQTTISYDSTFTKFGLFSTEPDGGHWIYVSGYNNIF